MLGSVVLSNRYYTRTAWHDMNHLMGLPWLTWPVHVVLFVLLCVP
jgi:hypothetical protein